MSSSGGSRGCSRAGSGARPGSGEEALHRALRALRPRHAPQARAPHRRPRLRGGGGPARDRRRLARSGRRAARQRSARRRSRVRRRPSSCCPKGANGIAAVVDHRLSVVTRGGFRLQVRASAAALSPHALYVAAGIGNSLVALAPDGRKAWRHPAGGKVVAIAWAPDGFRIAYVVHAGRRFVLREIYGNGAHDTVLDRSVRPVRPSWRADSRAFAYVGAGGKAILYDFAHQKHSVVATLTPVTRVFFPPVGKTLVVATPSEIRLGRRTVASGQVEALGWFGGLPAAALADRKGAWIRSFGPTGQAGRQLLRARQGRRSDRRARRHPGSGQDSRRLAREDGQHAPHAEESDGGRGPRDRLARPERDRDVARRGRDLRRPEAVERPCPELGRPGR